MVIIFVALKDFIAIHTHTHTLMALKFFFLLEKKCKQRVIYCHLFTIYHHMSQIIIIHVSYIY